MDVEQRSFFQNGSTDEALEGTFYFLRENPDGVRETLAAFALAIPPEGNSAFVDIPKLPRNLPAGTRCWVVFRGTLGTEPNVVAASEAGCPVEPPPPFSGSQWTVYQCVRLEAIPNNPDGAPPVYYAYATQNPPRLPEGDPVIHIGEERHPVSIRCTLANSVAIPDGPWPPDLRVEHLF
jgi:hypothetical protein